MWSKGYTPPFEEAFDYPHDQTHEYERQSWLNSAISHHDDDLKEFQQAQKKIKLVSSSLVLVKESISLEIQPI